MFYTSVGPVNVCLIGSYKVIIKMMNAFAKNMNFWTKKKFSAL